MMKIATAQLNYHIGNFESNYEKMQQAVAAAISEKADIIIFSELSVCGYPPRDFLEFTDFIKRCDEVVQQLAALSNNIAIVVGSPSVNDNILGKDLFNSAYFLAEGKVQQVVHKTLLPTYDVFDEYRYFEPNTEFNVVPYKGYNIALTVCEDLWNVGNENPLYTVCPMDELIQQQPDFIINISASPFDYNHAEDRKRVLKANCDLYHLPIFYVNHVGAQTELIFDGGSLIMNGDGSICDELPYFEEAIRYYEIQNSKFKIQKISKIPYTALNNETHSKISLIHDALVLGIKDYFKKLGFQKAILGLSGGIDSAIVLCLAEKALGKENVWAVLLPSQFSTDHSVNDAITLANNLGVKHDIISIENTFDALLKTLQPQFNNLPFGLAEENLQARIRANILMALSNKFGYILLNTSNKSEAAVGYGTLYGDMCGGLAVIADVYKTEVYELAHYINREQEIIPNNIITKAPSAELRPNQKDSDSLPDYDILDKILFQYIEQRKGPKELVAMGFEEALVKRILKLVNTNEYKRFQTPPILRISIKAFGMGRRMPIEGKYLS
jgi:NAD+ synthase (glutamine-hydrolysing)